MSLILPIGRTGDRFVVVDREVIVRFEDKFSRSDDLDDCWLWKAGCFSNGYGAFKLGGIMVKAHRLAWVIYRGPIPRGIKLEVMHDCPKGDNKGCVNPSHLRLGTPKQHGADRVAKGQQWQGEELSKLIKAHAARGRRNGRHTHPERTSRGERHSEIMKRVAARGERNGNVKLTNSQRYEEVPRLYEDGWSVSAIAARFGLCRKSIDHVLRSEGYK